MSEPTLYREATEADEGGEFRDVVPVEPAIVAIDQYGHVRNWGGLTGPKEGFYQIVRIEGAGIGGDDE